MRIDIALESVGGNRAQAAALLDLPKRKVQNAITDNAYLRDKWLSPGARSGVGPCYKAPTEAPTELETMQQIDVPVPCIPPVPPEHIALIPLIDDADARLTAGMEHIGLTQEEIHEAVGMVNYNVEHGPKTVHLFGAHLVKRGVRLSRLLDTLEQEIRDKDFRDIYSPDGSVLIRSGQESKFDLLYRGLAELRKMVDLAHTAALARAKVKLWEKHGTGNPNGGKARKPGFAPMERPTTLVNAQAGATVNLNGETKP